ncbi:MAG: AAA-like domain-containing protein [Aulosira sp. ZfuVER01]|nr:AAA-like domain-containing protein [Aulosira sp. ZfuVER01]MDZ8000660.1 AAA-like domain-containing protein [Aulosira sp. DedVER01a]MDZ8051775.1 AAA-like domain-containing protein [Aulosira sp. ZfuCHP01]
MSWDLVKACTVAIATPENSIRGTGFFISSQGHLLTCAHVVEATGGWENVRVNGQRVDLVYLGDRTCDDFAILQLPGYQGASVPLAVNFQPMDRFLSIGYGRSDFPQGASIDGTITDMNPQSKFRSLPMLRLRVKANSQQVQGGYSGSPVFNAATQRVIGIIAAYDNTEGALALPLATVLENWSDLEGLLHLETASDVEFPFFDTAFYADCYREVKRPGALIRLRAPLQWGKTYLMYQILNYGKTQQGYQAVRLDFQEPETRVFSTLKHFLKWVCSSIAEELNIPDKLAENWKGTLSANKDCTNYFEQYLLPAINSPLVLGLDNVDVIFSHQIARDFLPLLRSWYEKGRDNTNWQRLRLVIAYSKEDFIPIDTHKSPFNVGKGIEIPELNQLQVQNLAQRLQLPWNAEQVAQLMAMVGGHPWLVKEALDKIAQRELTLKELLEIAPTQEGLYGDHLLRHWSILQDNPELMRAMKQVVAANRPVRIGVDKAFKLRNMRLVKYTGNDVLPLCDLYRLYFCDRFGL